MKKIINYLIFSILLVFPLLVKAEGIENYYINATVQSNGDLLVEEYFYLNGEFNGFERIINYRNDDLYPFDENMESYGGSVLHNGSGIDIIEVKGLSINPNFDFTDVSGDTFNKVYRAEKGDYGVYTNTSNDNGISLLIYNPSTKNKAFYIKYLLKNIAINHNDVAELGWNIFGDELSESIAHLKVYVNFPNNQNKLRGWAHGPVKGNIKVLNNQTLEATIDGLYRYTAIDVRSTFDNSVISNSKKKTNVKALEKIIKYETDKAAQANYERVNQEKIKETEALESLFELENDTTRYNYNTAYDKILLLNDSDKKQEYLKELALLKEKLDKIEEKYALESVKYAEYELQYDYYEDALENVLILDNEELKETLISRLEIVKNKIIEKEHETEKNNYIVAAALFVIIIGCAVIVYIKYDKEYKPDFNENYYRDFPSNVHPTTLSYLFNRKITNDALSASILDLIRKKVVTYEKIDSKNYKLYNNSENFDNLSNIEKRLIKLIFNNKNKVELQKLKKESEKLSSSFMTNWSNFVDISLKTAKKEEYFIDDDKEKVKDNVYVMKRNIVLVLSILLISIPFVPLVLWGYLIYIYLKENKDYTKFAIYAVLIICMIVSVGFALKIGMLQHFVRKSIICMLINIVVVVIILIYMHGAIKKTQKGINEYSRWSAFKRFLEDFSRMDSRELPEISLWEKYLVYATVLGCADKLSEVMKIKVQELGMYENIDNFIDLKDIYYVNRIITSNVTKSINTARSVNHTYSSSGDSSSSGGSFSSGSGGGGGFSSGGGSFGGGGGGGRF